MTMSVVYRVGYLVCWKYPDMKLVSLLCVEAKTIFLLDAVERAAEKYNIREMFSYAPWYIMAFPPNVIY